MFRAGEDADEAPEHELKTALCLLRRKLRKRWLFTDDELQFGDDVDHEPPVRTERRMQGGAPARQLGVTFTEKRSHKAPKSLSERRIRNVALVLIELAG